MDPKLSVVIPVYNVELYLRQCLDSVVNQTYRNLEILLIDDGSPDTCGAICDAYAARDGRIRVLHKQNVGVSAARNDGIRLAAGEWITFVDPDDWLDLDYYEKMFAAMPAEPVDVLCSMGFFSEHPFKSVKAYTFEEPFADLTGEKTAFLIAKALAPRCGITKHKACGSNGVMWNKICRTRFLQRIPPMDESLHISEDVLYCMQLFAQAGGVAVCDCMGYHYRQQVPTSATNRFDPAWPQMFAAVEKKMTDFVAGQGASDLLLDASYAREIMLIKYMLRGYFFHPQNPAPHRQVAAEIREFKKRPYIAETVHSKSNRFLSKKQIVLKYALRQPLCWPLRVLQIGNQHLLRVKGV